MRTISVILEHVSILSVIIIIFAVIAVIFSVVVVAEIINYALEYFIPMVTNTVF